jgi:hypothetical protein
VSLFAFAVWIALWLVGICLVYLFALHLANRRRQR